MRVLIDGDVIVYEAGFASDAAQKARNERRVALGEAPGQDYEPLAFALQGVDMKLESIKKITNADEMVIYMSHPVNQREHWFPEYKQNRNVLHKPHHYSAIQDYLLDDLGALYSQRGDEADDALGIAQTADIQNSLIATKDKDLDVIPGWHYNWSKTKKDDGVYYVSPEEASRNFYTQLIKGDTSDNIPGLYKKRGMKVTKGILAPLEDMQADIEFYEYVKWLYNDDVEHIYNMAQLLWIKRYALPEGEKPWKAPN